MDRSNPKGYFMKCDINVNPKTYECTLDFVLKDYTAEKDYQNSLAILAMVSGDYNLDPELELEEFKVLITNGLDDKKDIIQFIIDEEGIEAELL
jgi:hypothetical protein